MTDKPIGIYNQRINLAANNFLICHSSHATRHTVTKFLRNLRAEKIHQCTTIWEAEKKLQQHPEIQVILCGWRWSDGKNGIQFCRDLKKRTPPFRYMFLLITSDSYNSDVVLAYEIGVDSYLVLPFDFKTFSEKVIQLVEDQKKPSKIKLALAKGFSCLTAGEGDAAELHFKEALNENSQSARARIGLGRVEENRGNHDQALAYYLEGVSQNPDFVEGNVELLRYYRERNQHETALEWAQKLVARSPDNPSYHIDMAILYLATEDIEKAEKAFRRVIRLSPRIAEAYKGLGDVKTFRREYDAALKLYGKALDIEPSHVSALNALGMAYAKKELHHEALQKYRLAISFDSRNEKLYFNMGTAYEALQQFSEALFCYRKSVQLKPMYPKAIVAVERLLKDHPEVGP